MFDLCQDKLESVLDMSHQQMEQYQDQPAHAEKIACQQKLLQEDVVHIRAAVSWVSTVRFKHTHTFDDGAIWSFMVSCL